jgi:hypothetical protein
MAEDGIPEILAGQGLGHQVPGMRGLYAHVSGRMRDDLRQALQARWEDSLRARAAINPRSPLPLLPAFTRRRQRAARPPGWSSPVAVDSSFCLCSWVARMSNGAARSRSRATRCLPSVTSDRRQVSMC